MADTRILALSTRATVLVCPCCSRALYEIGERQAARFFCSDGHRFTLEDICPGFEDLGRSLSEAIDVLVSG